MLTVVLGIYEIRALKMS